MEPSMRRVLIASIVWSLIFLVAGGCRTVHLETEDRAAIAMWYLPPARDVESKVRDVLLDHGILAEASERGVSVREADQVKARRVLLTDERLADTGLMLFAVVQAGTARATEAGLVAPLLMPDENDD
jgi:hypothetical protein